jgi:hypothetical protein
MGSSASGASVSPSLAQQDCPHLIGEACWLRQRQQQQTRQFGGPCSMESSYLLRPTRALSSVWMKQPVPRSYTVILRSHLLSAVCPVATANRNRHYRRILEDVCTYLLGALVGPPHCCVSWLFGYLTLPWLTRKIDHGWAWTSSIAIPTDKDMVSVLFTLKTTRLPAMLVSYPATL